MKLDAVFPPMATVFDRDGSVDGRAISSNVAKWIQAGVGGVVALGSNGEAPFVDEDEADRVIAAARDAVPRDRVLIVGTGRESTRATIAASARAAALGADAVLVRTPSFFKARMTPDVFVRHYTAVADASPVPVLLYNLPAVTGVNLTPDAVGRLATHPNIIGMKESGSDTAQFAAFVASAPATFAVIAGSAPTFYPSLCVGATGGILAVSCVLPGALRAAARALPRRPSCRGTRPAAAADAARQARDDRPRRGRPQGGDGPRGLRRRRAPRAARSADRRGDVAGPRRPRAADGPIAIHLIDPRDLRRGEQRSENRDLTPGSRDDTRTILLGPGPSPVSARVMRAMAAPVLSHLDPEMVAMLDDMRRGSTGRSAPGRARSPGVSGTGTSGMEAAVANVTSPGTRVLVVVTGYFGDRLAQMCQRYGATVTRVDVEWGRACDPAAVERALAAAPADIVAIVHAETSTGVLNPVPRACRDRARAGALTIVDAVTSFGAMPLETDAWGIDVCYSCSQKGLGAPSGLAPLSFSARALSKKVPSRSFYLDLALLEDYWVRRKYHHTMSSPLVYALREALAVVEEEGLEQRWARHERNHRALAAGLDALGLSLLPPAGERLWTLNAVRVPDGIDEAAVRRRLLEEFSIEIGAGPRSARRKIWRVGLMGAGSTLANVLLFLAALERVLGASGYRVPSATAAATAAEAAGRG